MTLRPRHIPAFALVLFALLAPLAPAAFSQITPSAAPKACTADTSDPLPSDTKIWRREFSAATRTASRALEADSSSVPLQAAYIRALLYDDKAHEGLAAARTLQTAHLNDPIALTALGEALNHMGAFNEAARVLARSLSINHCIGRTFYAVSRAENAIGYSADFARHIKVAHSLSPKDDDITLDFLWLRPDEDAYASLSAYVDSSRYMTAEMLLDAHGDIASAKAMSEAQCTVSAPAAGTTATMHYAVDSGALVVPARFGSSTRDLVISGNENNIVISGGLATMLGLKRIAKHTASSLFAGGRRRQSIAIVPSIRFGDVEYKNCPVTIEDEVPSFPHEQGRIGLRFFRDFVVRVDPADEIFALTPLPSLLDPKPKLNDLRWSDAASSAGNPVPSMNGGPWDYANRVIDPSMTDWVRTFTINNNILLPTKVGPGAAKLFYMSASEHDLLIAPREVADTAFLSRSIPQGATPISKEAQAAMSGYKNFYSIGTLITPVNQWETADFTRYNHIVGISIAGVLPVSFMAQLDITYDARDNLMQIKHPKKKLKRLR